MTQETTSPSFKEPVVNTFVSEPTELLLINHWYVGLVPPFIGTAPNVATSPSHILEDDTETNTLGSTIGATSTIKVSILERPQQIEVVCKVTSYVPVSPNV